MRAIFVILFYFFVNDYFAQSPIYWDLKRFYRSDLNYKEPTIPNSNYVQHDTVYIKPKDVQKECLKCRFYYQYRKCMCNAYE